MVTQRHAASADLRDMWGCVWERYKNPRITQRDIAAILGLSETKVSRLLDRAAREGLIKTTVEVTPPRIAELEAQLCERFELFDAVVIPSTPHDRHAERQNVGIAAARYFEWVVREGSKIAVGSGTTLIQMVQHLTPRKFRSLKLYPLAVTDLGLQADAAEVVEFFPNALVAAMRNKYGRDVQAFNFQVAPVGDRELSQSDKIEILERNSIRHLFEEAMDADVFFVGIGSLKQINPRVEAVFRYCHTDLEQLRRRAQGYINFQVFDSRKVLLDEFSGLNRIICVTMSHLRRMAETPGKHVIAVAAGQGKIEAVAASLSPDIRCYDILIADELIAEGILGTGQNWGEGGAPLG